MCICVFKKRVLLLLKEKKLLNFHFVRIDKTEKNTRQKILYFVCIKIRGIKSECKNFGVDKLNFN